MTKFWAGAPVYGRLLGRTKEGLKDLCLGVLSLDAEFSAKILANWANQAFISLARFAHLRWAAD